MEDFWSGRLAVGSIMLGQFWPPTGNELTSCLDVSLTIKDGQKKGPLSVFVITVALKGKMAAVISGH